MKRPIVTALIVGITPFLIIGAGAGGAAGDVFDWPTSVRHFGMGFTGTADDAPGNAFCNPANLATLSGVHYTAAYGELYPYWASDMWAFGNGVSVGFQDVLSGSTPVGLGAEFRYSRYDYGRSVQTDATGHEIGEFDSGENALGVAGAGCVQLGETYTLAAGVGLKRWSANYGGAIRSGGEVIEVKGSGFFVDAGVRAAASFVTESGYAFTPALGVSYWSKGSDIDMSGVGTIGIPEIVNYGASLRVETPPEQSVTDFVEAEVPLAAFTVNIDVNDPRRSAGTTMYGIGVEVAVIQMFFLRAGYMDAEHWNEGETTLGAGVGAANGRLRGRLEFARVPSGLEDTNRYGVSLGVLF